MRRRIFAKIHLTIFLILILLLASFGQEEFRKFPPNPDPFRVIKFPEEKNYKLSNGLNIVFITRKNLTLVNLYLVILAGDSFSPKEFPGLATFTANMLDKGTKFLSSERVIEEVELIGGNLSIETELDYTVIKFTFLEEYLNEALKILRNIIVEPNFPSREVENERRRLFFDLRKKKTDSKFLARKMLFKILFPENHPYYSPFLRIDTLRKINRNIIFGFYNKYYRPNNSYLIIEGHLNFRELVKKVSHHLNIWKRKNIQLPEFPPVSPYDKKIVYFIDSPNIKRPFICLGNFIGNNSNEEFFSLIVINQILGGTTTSRLFMNLRESKEYAFDARSYINFLKKSGIFVIEVEVKPEFVKQSIQECLSEIEKINHQSIPIFELEQAKYYLIGNFPLQLNSIEGFSEYLMKKVVFGFKNRFWDDYQENIMMVDQTRISAVARKYFSRFPAIIVVGNRKEILEPLLDFEIVELYDVDGKLKYRIEKGI